MSDVLIFWGLLILAAEMIWYWGSWHALVIYRWHGQPRNLSNKKTPKNPQPCSKLEMRSESCNGLKNQQSTWKANNRTIKKKTKQTRKSSKTKLKRKKPKTKQKIPPKNQKSTKNSQFLVEKFWQVWNELTAEVSASLYPMLYFA